MITTPASITSTAAATSDASPAGAGPTPDPALPTTMRAAGRARYGSAEVVEVTTRPVPEVGPREVLVRVAAAGVDRGVWHLMTGLPRLVRIAGYGIRRPKQFTLGLDVAGTVVAVGDQVTRFQVGDEVFGIGDGTFATHAVASEAKLVHRPADLPVREAAAAPISGITALQAVHDHARVQAGDRVLILGASGGVGTYAVQLAVEAGADVTGVASAAKSELVRGLGATRVVDYATTDVTEGAERYDVIIDIGGTHPVRHLRRILTPSGTLVIVGGEGGGSWTGGVGRQLRAKLLSPFVGQRLTFFISPESLEDLERLREALTAGTLTPQVGATYGLHEVPQAMADLEAGRITGKAAILVG